MKRNITVLMTIFIAVVFSLTTTYVMPANVNAGWALSSHDGNLNDNDNNNNNELKTYGTVTSVDPDNLSFVTETQTGKSYEVSADSAQIKAEHVLCKYWLVFSDLRVGHMVKTKGWLIDVQKIHAYEIEVFNYKCPGPKRQRVKVKGKIGEIFSDQDDPEKGKLMVEGKKIEVNSRTKFNPLTMSFSDLSKGQKINVKGRNKSDGEIKALVIKVN